MELQESGTCAYLPFTCGDSVSGVPLDYVFLYGRGSRGVPVVFNYWVWILLTVHPAKHTTYKQQPTPHFTRKPSVLLRMLRTIFFLEKKTERKGKPETI